MKKLLVLLAALMLVGCATAPTSSVMPTPEIVRVEVEVTRVVEVTRIVVQSPTIDATKLHEIVHAAQTAVYSVTPATVVNTPEPVSGDQAMAPKSGAGSYLVPDEWTPGIWRSSGQGDSCDLTLNNLDGGLEDITTDPPGATFRIPDRQLVAVVNRASSCTWTFMQP